MCLSTVYKNTVTPETVAMKNVMKIECQGDMVILTDLMERQMAIHGELVMAKRFFCGALLRAGRSRAAGPRT